MKQKLFPSRPLLLVDDEASWLRSISRVLKNAGIDNLVQCTDSRKVMETLAGQKFSLVLLDLTMPNVSGETLLPQILENHPEVCVIIVTGINQVETAVRCMRKGAFDFLVKTDEAERLVLSVRNALEVLRLKTENLRIKESLLETFSEVPKACSKMVTQDGQMLTIFRYLEAVAGSPEPLLITGESGVGKELVAQAVHDLRGECEPWVALNVAGLDDNLFADTLFGHVKGAFSGAEQVRNGMIEEAGTGTLFLDEIGDLSSASQLKLLRLLQEGEYHPVGSDRPKKTNARIILATNVDLKEKLAAGQFRKDLYYRLSTHHVHIPPLRERLGDIPLLLDHYLEEAAQALGKKKPTPPAALQTLLMTYHFPGNIRELRALVYDAVLVHRKGVLSMEGFKKALLKSGSAQGCGVNLDLASPEQPQLVFTDQLPTLADAADLVVAEAMNRAQGNQVVAASLLGITRQALNKRINKTKD